jgi:hypothetical protein
VLDGEPQTVAWSLPNCDLCDAPAESVVRAAARGFMPRVRLALQGVAPRMELLGAGGFNHEAALAKLNESVDLINAALSRCKHALDEAALAALAKHAAAARGLTVVSYCDGKGSLLGFLLRAGVQVRRYLSVEIDPNANRVCRTHYGAGDENLEPGALRFWADCRKLTVAKLKAMDVWPVHLLFGSTPCNDLSGCNEAAQGLEGPDSRLFLDFCSFTKALRADNGGVPLAVLAENVVPTHRADVTAMTHALGLPALTSEAAVFEAARRPRLLFTNLRQQPVPESMLNKTLQSVLNPGAVALSQKAGCILSSLIEGAAESVATHREHSQRNRGRTLVLCAAHSTDVRGLQIPELCRALGQPAWEVDAARGGEQVKCGLLGRSLAAGQILHVLRSFTEANIAAQRSREVD